MATSSAASEPILSRVERLDQMMSCLEEIKGINGRVCTVSTTSSGTAGSVTSTEFGGNSSVSSSPKSVDQKKCKPIEDVVVETRVKGSLIDRVDQLENRLVHQLEEDIGKEKKREPNDRNPGSRDQINNQHRKPRGLKALVRSCIKGDLKTKD